MSYKGLPSSIESISHLESIKKYSSDLCRHPDAQAAAVLLPYSEKQVIEIVQWAIESQTPIIPAGARQGLCGSVLANPKQVIVSFENMDRIKIVSDKFRRVSVQPGVTLHQLTHEVKAKGWSLPFAQLDPGKGQLGGMVAMNSAQSLSAQYGPFNKWLRKIRYVDGLGNLVDSGSPLAKSLQPHLMMTGSRGQLGLITDVELECVEKEGPVSTFLLGVSSTDAIGPIKQAVEANYLLRRLEFFNFEVCKNAMENYQIPKPFEKVTPYYLLVEVEGALTAIIDPLEKMIDDFHNKLWIEDAVISRTKEQHTKLWDLSRSVLTTFSERLSYHFDIQFNRFPDADTLSNLQRLVSREFPDFDIFCWGALGSENLTLSLLHPSHMAERFFMDHCRRGNTAIFAFVNQVGGQVLSSRSPEDPLSKSLEIVAGGVTPKALEQLKKVFDPHNILNP